MDKRHWQCAEIIARLEAEIERQKKRLAVGGDIFEAGRNSLILQQTVELGYLNQIDNLEAELVRLREENAKLKDEIKSLAHGIVAILGINKMSEVCKALLKFTTRGCGCS